MAVECIQEGTVDHSVVYPRKVLERALLHKASGFILAHNHPSGDPNPSPEDKQITNQIRECGKIMEIELLDHIVIGRDCFASI